MPDNPETEDQTPPEAAPEPETDEEDDDDQFSLKFLEDPRDQPPEPKKEEPKEPVREGDAKEHDGQTGEKADAKPGQVSEPSPPAPAQQAAQQAAPPQPETPAQPAPAPTQQIDGAALQKEAERVALEKMAEHFQLSDGEVEEYTSEPEKALPKLAAKVMLRTVQTTVEAIRMLLPQVIQGHMNQENEAKAAENRFYEAWPQLKDREDAKPLIVQHATVFRQMYPKASVEDVVRNVGAGVMVSLGIHAQPAPSPGAETKPGGNGSQVVRRESLPPHRPAASTPPRELAPPKQPSVWETMLED